MSRILLVLARKTYRARAFLDAARAARVEVVVASDHRASLGDLTPDGNVTVWFDDVNRSTERLRTVLERRPVDAVIPGEDEGVVLAARIAEAAGIPHSPVDAVARARDKAAVRARMAEAGLPGPRFTLVPPDEESGQAAARVPFPCVLKPLSLAASRGVIRADDPTQFAAALARVRSIIASASSSGPRFGPPTASGAEVLVEEFLPGREVALEGVLREGRLTTLALLDKPDPLDGPYFEETMLVTPSRLPESLQASIRAHVAEVIDVLGLTEGPVHAEVRVDEEHVRLLEVAPRSIGGHCSRILRFDGDRSLEHVLLDHALAARGRESGAPASRRIPGASGVMMLPIPGAGVLEGVEGQARARMVPGIEALEITIPPGEEVAPPPEGNRYLGFLFARADRPEQVERALRSAHGYLDVRLTESS
jgi:biotin carboxylase